MLIIYIIIVIIIIIIYCSKIGIANITQDFIMPSNGVYNLVRANLFYSRVQIIFKRSNSFVDNFKWAVSDYYFAVFYLSLSMKNDASCYPD